MAKPWKRAIAMGLLAVCLALSIGACTVNKTEIQTGAEEFRDSETEKIGA